MTGTSALLEVLSPLIPDAEINAWLPRHRGSGRRADWSSAQLLRTLLLQLLTPARTANLLCALLPEQRAWRRFAHLPHRWRTPTPRQLHEFRARLTPQVLRTLNAFLGRRLLATWPAGQPGLALIDATDLPASCNEYKKSQTAAFLPRGRKSAFAPKRRVKPSSSWAIRNIRCGSGWLTTRRRCSSCL